MHEAKIEDTETGRRTADDGWFVLNLAEMGWETVPEQEGFRGLTTSDRARAPDWHA
jgi:hypothetical protein